MPDFGRIASPAGSSAAEAPTPFTAGGLAV
jgi:hypothetical protein